MDVRGWLDRLREWLRLGGEVRMIGWLTAAIGVYSGYALFLMVWEQQQQQKTALEFLAALGAAAGLSFAFEFLRSTIEGGNQPWSFPRVLATIVMLAALELFVIATESAVGLGTGVAAGVAGFIFGEQFEDPQNPIWNLLALGALWLFVALMMIRKLRKFIERWPYPNSSEQPGKPLGKYLTDMGPDLLRGACGGALAGAIWGPVASVVYVFFFRAVFLAQWIHAHPNDWAGSLIGVAPLHLTGLPTILMDVPILVAGWCAEKLGAAGIFIGIAVAAAIARAWASEGDKTLATLWPPAVILLVLGSPMLADATARHDLLALAGLSAVIWGIPGLVLGLLSPLLRGAAHHPPVWGVVATAAAAVLMVVTLARFEAPDAERAEKLLLLGATALAVFLALQLFQGRWSEEFWLFVALSVGMIVFGTTRVAQSVNLFYMQENAHQLIAVSLGVPQEAPGTASIAPYDYSQEIDLNGGGMGALMRLGVGSPDFKANPCAAVQSFTADQRASFVSGLQTGATEEKKAADTALEAISDNTQTFATFQQQWTAAVVDAGAPAAPGTAGAQISEVSARLLELERLDETRQELADWAAPPVAQTGTNFDLVGLGLTQTVCQTDLDTLVANLATADQDRRTAEVNLAALRQRVAAGLPNEDALKGAEDEAAAVRDKLQVAQAQRVELAMTSSLGFWLTIGLLAMWRLTRPEAD